jgi:hypothetical protein
VLRLSWTVLAADGSTPAEANTAFMLASYLVKYTVIITDSMASMAIARKQQQP